MIITQSVATHHLETRSKEVGALIEWARHRVDHDVVLHGEGCEEVDTLVKHLCGEAIATSRSCTYK